MHSNTDSKVNLASRPLRQVQYPWKDLSTTHRHLGWVGFVKQHKVWSCIWTLLPSHTGDRKPRREALNLASEQANKPKQQGGSFEQINCSVLDRTHITLPRKITKQQKSYFILASLQLKNQMRSQKPMTEKFSI